MNNIKRYLERREATGSKEDSVQMILKLSGRSNKTNKLIIHGIKEALKISNLNQFDRTEKGASNVILLMSSDPYLCLHCNIKPLGLRNKALIFFKRESNLIDIDTDINESTVTIRTPPNIDEDEAILLGANAIREAFGLDPLSISWVGDSYVLYDKVILVK